MKRFFCVAVATLLVLVPASVAGLGPEGHEVIGTLAEVDAQRQGETGFQGVLGNVNAGSVSNWADQIRNGARNLQLAFR